MKLPKHIAHYAAVARANGHELVSQGCAMFRCTKCGLTSFLDDGKDVFQKTCVPEDGRAFDSDDGSYY